MITVVGQSENEERHINTDEKWKSDVILINNAQVFTGHIHV